MNAILARWFAALILAVLLLILAPETDGLMRRRGAVPFAIIVLTVLFALLLNALRVAFK